MLLPFVSVVGVVGSGRRSGCDDVKRRSTRGRLYESWVSDSTVLSASRIPDSWVANRHKSRNRVAGTCTPQVEPVSPEYMSCRCYATYNLQTTTRSNSHVHDNLTRLPARLKFRSAAWQPVQRGSQRIDQSRQTGQDPIDGWRYTRLVRSSSDRQASST